MPTRSAAAPPATHRRAEELVRGLEVMIGKLADPGIEVPLHLIDRLERALQTGHRANLLRLGVVEERALRQLESSR